MVLRAQAMSRAHSERLKEQSRRKGPRSNLRELRPKGKSDMKYNINYSAIPLSREEICVKCFEERFTDEAA